MLDDLDKAERQWRERSLFRRRRGGGRWWRWLLLIAVASALLVWQEETLAWLADLLA
ncbi:MAG: hypothetical protein AB1450_05830 [Pseudomonadota bacterium]